MPIRVITTATYTQDADTVFAAASDFNELMDAMSSIAVYEGFPTTPLNAGETFSVDVTFWGWLKNKGHMIDVVAFDREKRLLQSHEYGNNIRNWDHVLTVSPTDQGCVWVDDVTIDAGWQTWIMSRFAAYVYRTRHKHRKALNLHTQYQRIAAT